MNGQRLLEIKQEMDTLRSLIQHSLVETPDDFDGREPLWMRREDLRLELRVIA